MNQKSKNNEAGERAGFELTSPMRVLERDDLTREQKVEMLRQWEIDLREEMVAEEENMASTQPLEVTLDEVLEALRALGATSKFQDAPTKHG